MGMGWANHVPAVDEPITALLRWAEDLADAFEGNLDGDLRMDFSDVPSDPFGGLPTEVVVEWNATLPVRRSASNARRCHAAGQVVLLMA
jgi:hypothetical protein